VQSERRWRRLRHATGRMKKENVRWVMAVIKAKAVAVASACLYHMIYSSNVLIYI